MKSSYLVALVVTLALLVPTSFAVICSSFATPDSCNGTYTDVGLCEWDATTKTCFATDVPLPPGMVGITAIPSYDGPDDPPVMVDPPPLIQDPPPTVPDKTSPDTSTSSPPVTNWTPPVVEVAISQWIKVNLNNTQVVSPITTEVQNLLPTTATDNDDNQSTATTITPLCIYKRDPDVWAIYSTQQEGGYVLARTSCSVSITAGDDKEETSCMYFLMDFDGNSSDGGTSGSSAGGSDGTVGVIEPMPVPEESSSGVVSMSVQPESTSITSNANNNNSYSLISVSAAEELCNVGPIEEEPMVGGDDILLMEPDIDDGAEKSDDVAFVEEVASSSGSGVVMRTAGVMMMMMVVGLGVLV